MARKTYTTAAGGAAVQPTGRGTHILRAWRTSIFMADWKQALRFEQTASLRPDDEIVRKQLVNLNLRADQQQTIELRFHHH
jgi:hypothetical protein